MADYSLFLDDTREPSPSLKGEVVIARTYDEFVRTMQRYGCPKFISFDHDLGPVGVQPSGMDCAKWLVNWILDDRKRLPEDFAFAVHSMNPAGAANINGLMSQFLEHMAAEQFGAVRGLLSTRTDR